MMFARARSSIVAVPLVVLLAAAIACEGGASELPDSRPDEPDASTGSISGIIDEAPDAITAQRDVRFAFHADADATFTCRIDDWLIDPCESPLDVNVGSGEHVFVVTATGTSGPTAGVVDQTPPVLTWRVDLFAPETILRVGPPVLDNAAFATFQFAADEPGVTYECALDGGAFVPCDALFLAGPLSDGQHTLLVRAVDQAGNVDPSPLSITWTVDLSTPDTIIDDAPVGLVGPAPAEVVFSSTAGPGATYTCSLDGAAPVACTSPWTLAGLASGLHVAQVAVTSAAGTTDPSPATRIWTVDATAPTLTLTAAPSDPSIDHRPTFAFEAVTADVALDGWTCAVDDMGPPVACASPWLAPSLEYGEFTFRLTGVDAFGNQAALAYTWLIEPGCGDGVLDVGEACDDGDQVDGDGCNASCTSDETCGNGVHDPQVGETCDDGNRLNNDGCYADCQLDDHFAPVVELVAAPPTPSTFHTDLAFAFAADEAVAWTCAIDGVVGPAACASGWSPGILREGTYVFRLVATDAAGNTTEVTHGWTITMWRQVTPATSPSGRLASAATFDAGRGEVLQFGGSPAAATYSSETWAWDGSTWIDRTPAVGSPTGRQYLALTYVPTAGRVLLHGGSSGTVNPFTMYADTQRWDGAAWTDVTPTPNPLEGRGFHAIAYDSTNDNVVLFGGYVGFVVGPAGYRNDTWLWDGAAWTQATPTGAVPGVRYGHALVDDPAHGRVVLFGGHDGTRLNDTWSWDGAAWTQLTPAVSPSVRRYHAMMFDRVRQVVILFGGWGPSLRNNDTWMLDGDVWTLLAEAGPSPRYMAAMAYDDARDQGVLFGGWAGAYSAETWLFE